MKHYSFNYRKKSKPRSTHYRTVPKHLLGTGSGPLGIRYLARFGNHWVKGISGSKTQEMCNKSLEKADPGGRAV